MRYGSSVVRFQKPILNSRARKVVKAARAEAKKRKNRNRAIKFAKRELPRLLARELPGAKVSQIAYAHTMWHGKEGIEITYSARLSHADEELDLAGTISRMHVGLRQYHARIRNAIEVDGHWRARVSSRHVSNRLFGKTIEVTYSPEGGYGFDCSRSEFLFEVAEAVRVIHGERLEESAEKAAGKTDVGVDVPRSRKSLLAS